MSVALIVGAVVLVASALVVVVGWANARTQPRASDSPYRLPSGSPMSYILFAVLAVAIAIVAVGVVGAAVMAVAGT